MISLVEVDCAKQMVNKSKLRNMNRGAERMIFSELFREFTEKFKLLYWKKATWKSFVENVPPDQIQPQEALQEFLRKNL
jgi:hypothetical protein